MSFSIVDCTTRPSSRILSKVSVYNSTIRARPINCSTSWTGSKSSVISERGTRNWLIIISCTVITDCSTSTLSRILSKVSVYNSAIFRPSVINCTTRTTSGSISSVIIERWTNNRLIMRFTIVNCTTRTISYIVIEIHILNICKISCAIIDCTTRTRNCWIFSKVSAFYTAIIRFVIINCTTRTISYIVSERWTNNRGNIGTRIMNCTTSSISRILSKISTFYTTIIRWRIIDCTTITTSSYIVSERWTNNRLVTSILAIVDCSTTLSRILSKVTIINITISRITINNCTTRTISYIVSERWTNNWVIFTFIEIYSTSILISGIISKVTIINTSITGWIITDCTTTSRISTWFSYVFAERWINNWVIFTSWSIKDCSTRGFCRILSKVSVFNSTISIFAIDCSTTICVWLKSSTSLLSSIILRE